MAKSMWWLWPIVGLLLAAPLLLAATLAATQEKPPLEPGPPLEELYDRNNNKLFDNLERRLGPAAPSQPFDVIVHFTQPLSDIDFPAMKGQIGNFDIKYSYRSIDAVATTLTKGQIIALAQHGLVKQIEYDAEMVAFLDKATQWFGVQKARADFAVNGNLDGAASYSKNDIVIAIIDSGVDTGHVDLDGGKVLAKYNAFDGTGTAVDDCGHGTHVASMAAGEGEGDSRYTGVAPGAALVAVKVLKKQGQDCVGSTSAVNAGIEWVISNKDTYGIEILNLSLGIAGCSNGTDSTSLLVNKAFAAGIVPMVAAGNEGPGKCTVGAPGAAKDGVTVGAMADVEPGTAASFGCGPGPGWGFYLACFSSRGPTADGRIKPDIASPGVFITAAQAGTSKGYVQFSGTSMATPFTAGVAALMLHKNPSLSPKEIKDRLMGTVADWGPFGKDNDYGAGVLDGYQAVKAAGGVSGEGIVLPEHQFFTGNLTGTGDEDNYTISVVTTTYPIAATLIMPTWGDALGCGVGGKSPSPDFDLYLYDPNNTLLAKSETVRRQETIGYKPTVTGNFRLRVYSFCGSGNYFFDLSAGTEAGPSITLLTDGWIAFGVRNLNETADTTPSGINDAQTVKVQRGAADLFVRSGVFSDGITSTWSLGTTNGANQVKWEVSPNGTGWTTFTNTNTLYLLASKVATGASQNVYLRLTTPSSTTSNNQHGVQTRIVAVAPGGGSSLAKAQKSGPEPGSKASPTPSPSPNPTYTPTRAATPTATLSPSPTPSPSPPQQPTATPTLTSTRTPPFSLTAIPKPKAPGSIGSLDSERIRE